MKNILVIGSLNVDFSISVDKIAKDGETVNANGLIINNGGKGANQAYTIGKLGGKVKMIGAVGKDSYGKDIKNSLKKVNVGVKSIFEDRNYETGKAFINVSKDGENAISIIHGANYIVSKKLIDKNISLINKADIILIQLEIPLEVIKYILEIAKNKIIILDPAPADKKIMDFNLENVYLVKPNETEIETLTGIHISNEDDIKKAAKILINKGIKNVVLTLGEKGCYLISENIFKFYESIKSNAVDTTAAGDSFIASIALCLSKGMSLDDSIKFASKVSSIVVSKKGAQSSIPSYEEII